MLKESAVLHNVEGVNYLATVLNIVICQSGVCTAAVTMKL